MKKKQFKRWREFSTRMAMHGFPDATEARKQKILNKVNHFLDRMECVRKETEDWDGNEGEIYVCDWLMDFVDETMHVHEEWGRETKFENQVSCCIRAGFDRAVYPSAGVLGFDVGMLRRMWDGKIPKWVTKGFEPPVTAETPDDAGVWL